MKSELIDFITHRSFPCVMAKMVTHKGKLIVHTENDIDTAAGVQSTLGQLYQFVEEFKQDSKKLASFVLLIKNAQRFETFERDFWHFLCQLDLEDKKRHPHDPRVSSNPEDNNFSFSIKSEAFFILVLHPQSPRWARRFKHTAIVFNPHIQFEKLREAGVFKKIRNTIRFKDKLLQGTINPMLSDFGDRSEVFQYTGKRYGSHEKVPLMLRSKYAHNPT